MYVGLVWVPRRQLWLLEEVVFSTLSLEVEDLLLVAECIDGGMCKCLNTTAAEGIRGPAQDDYFSSANRPPFFPPLTTYSIDRTLFVHVTTSSSRQTRP